MYLDHCTNLIDFELSGPGHRTGFFDFSPLRDTTHKLVRMITHEPLHLAWWYFARTCTLTTAWTLLNFKVKGQGHVSFFFVRCFHCAWRCGYLHNTCTCTSHTRFDDIVTFMISVRGWQKAGNWTRCFVLYCRLDCVWGWIFFELIWC